MEVSQIYYKKSGKSRTVVAMHSDMDIPDFLAGYPMFTACGKPSKKSVMVMVVDLVQDRKQTSTRVTPAKSHIDVTGSDALKSRKRSLPFSSAIGGTGEADARDLELIEMAEAATRPKKTNNDLWNDLHCDLVRELEKKGTLSRYSVRHLKLWTDYILEGKSAGVGDEPKWEDHIDLVGVPPLKRKEKENSIVFEKKFLYNEGIDMGLVFLFSPSLSIPESPARLKEFAHMCILALVIIKMEDKLRMFFTNMDKCIKQGSHSLGMLLEALYTYLFDTLITVNETLEEISRQESKTQSFYCSKESTGGRPRYVITKEQITQLHETGLSWKAVAECFHVSEKTLYRRRLEFGMDMEQFTNITDSNLEMAIREILERTPNAGETYVCGGLRSQITAQMESEKPFKHN
ncbi:hypothetical protein QZH41_001311 [Actinostola sp. cb2023]|nr:hypothetical protein QZH41_001311 [Actinostola sp. cb2023]